MKNKLLHVNLDVELVFIIELAQIYDILVAYDLTLIMGE